MVSSGCDGSIDLAIILDKSGSIQHERFEGVKQFLVDVVTDLEVFGDKVRVALVSFDDVAQLHFGLNFYDNMQVCASLNYLVW